MVPTGIWQAKFLVLAQPTSSHLPFLSILTQSWLALVSSMLDGWLSFQDVNCPAVQVTPVSKSPEKVRAVPSENV